MIQWIRSLVCFIGLNIIGITLISFMILTSFFIPEAKYRYLVKLWCQIALAWIRISAGIRYKIYGLEHLDELQKTPSIVISNHQSTFETFLLPTILPTHAFVLKKELLNIPIFGMGLRRLQPIAIDRSKGKSAFSLMLQTSKQRLAKGISIVIFPEGTRVAPEKKAPYKNGAFVLASKLQAPILPISHNSGLAWRKGQLLKNRGTIEVTIGPLIQSQNRSVDELKQLTEEWIETHKPKILQP